MYETLYYDPVLYYIQMNNPECGLLGGKWICWTCGLSYHMRVQPGRTFQTPCILAIPDPAGCDLVRVSGLEGATGEKKFCHSPHATPPGRQGGRAVVSSQVPGSL
jgi:hypothetical protein